MTYPYSIKQVRLHHKGGTKSYEVTTVTSANADLFVVRRWGKNDAIATGGGQLKIERFSLAGSSNQVVNSIINEKQKGGYEVQDTKTPIALSGPDAADFFRKLLDGKNFDALCETIIFDIEGDSRSTPLPAFKAENKSHVIEAPSYGDWGEF